MNNQEMTDLLAEITRRIREVSDPEQIILLQASTCNSWKTK